MTTELIVLALAALLQVVQFCIYSVLGNQAVGVRYAASPRDTPRELPGYAGRSQRALNNHFEALILFTIAVLIVTLGDRATGFSANCAWVYLGARILYIPAYYFGWAPWRSLIWFVGFLSTILMILSALIS